MKLTFHVVSAPTFRLIFYKFEVVHGRIPMIVFISEPTKMYYRKKNGIHYSFSTDISCAYHYCRISTTTLCYEFNYVCAKWSPKSVNALSFSLTIYYCYCYWGYGLPPFFWSITHLLSHSFSSFAINFKFIKWHHNNSPVVK